MIFYLVLSCGPQYQTNLGSTYFLNDQNGLFWNSQTYLSCTFTDKQYQFNW